MNSDQLADRLNDIVDSQPGLSHFGVDFSIHTGLNFRVRGRSVPRALRALEDEENIFVSEVTHDHGEVVMGIRTSDSPGDD